MIKRILFLGFGIATYLVSKNIMATPPYVTALEGDGFPTLDIEESPLKAYTAAIAWLTSFQKDKGELAEGRTEGTLDWPVVWRRRRAGIIEEDEQERMDATVNEIRGIVNAMEWSLTQRDHRANRNLTTAITLTLKKVHTDHFEHCGPRVYYAAAACTALLL